MNARTGRAKQPRSIAKKSPRAAPLAKGTGKVQASAAPTPRQALEEINSRLAAMASGIENLAAGPIDRFVAQVVSQLEEGPWGEVLTELHRLDQTPVGEDPGDLREQLTMLRLALFAALGIRPSVPEQRIRLSKAQAQSCRWADGEQGRTARIATYEVVSPGWTRGDTVLLPPMIRSAARATESRRGVG